MEATREEVTLLAHADVLMLLADLLRTPEATGAPGVPGVPGGLWSAGAVAELPMLLEAAGWTAELQLFAAWSDLGQAIAQADPRAWAVEHHRLFEGAMACPLNQTAYVRRDKGAILGDLCGFYRAFNLTTSTDSGEKPDHLVTELQFLALLLVMQAQALRAGQSEQEQITADAASAFACDHLSDWLALLIAQLRLTAQVPLYGQLAQVLERTWQALAGQHGWPGLVEAAGPVAQIETEPPSDECALSPDMVPLLLGGRAVTPTGE